MLSSLLKKNKEIKVSTSNSTKENKKIEFPVNFNNTGYLTCENKKKQNEHFKFDVGNLT
jgi:hypothetical protein